MTPGYADGASFRQALEARLMHTAGERGVPLNTLRQKVVMERMLARLFARDDAPWRLKGGYAMELRLAGRARTTRDLDLAALPPTASPSEAHDPLLESLRDAALLDLGDYLDFAVAGPGEPFAADLPGGFRFTVTVTLDGRRYAGFHIDVGLDPEPAKRAELLTCEDHLAFAAIAPARVLLVPRERQFAEKIHAYTRPWGDRTNTRTKDLIDLLLLLDLGIEDQGALRQALDVVFSHASGHSVPRVLAPPPATWAADFRALAQQVRLTETSLEAAFGRLAASWELLGLGESPTQD